MKKIVWLMVLLVTLSVGIIGCAQADYAMEAPMAEEMESVVFATQSPTMATSASETGTDSGFSTGSTDAEPVKRVVIKNASMTITVDDPSEVIQEITLLAERLGGWVVSSSTSQQYYYDAEEELTSGTITIRIPAEGLTSTLSEIKGLTWNPKEDVSAERVTGQDVTSDYTDLESRLRNLEDAADALRGFMENAEDTEAVLEVFNQLNNVNEEIELVKGQLNYYDEASAMSSVTVEVLPKYEPVEPEPYEAPEWNPGKVFDETLERLVEFFQDFVDFMIRFVFGFIPRLIVILAPGALLIYLMIVIVKKLKKSKKNTPLKEKPEAAGSEENNSKQ